MKKARWSSLKEGRIMAKIEKSITINAPVEQVFAYISDPTNQTEWIPSIIESKDHTGSGVGQHWRWTYKMVGVRLEGESTVMEHIPNERRVFQTKGGAVSTWTFTFKPHDGGTKLKMDIDYTIPIPVLGKLAEKLVLRRNEREADLAMTNIKDKMEG
jgi:carbon monoxide dehydrogenase subunit G